MRVRVVVDRAPHAGRPDEDEQVENAWHGGDEVAGVLLGGVCVGVLRPFWEGAPGGVRAEEGVEDWEVGFGVCG